VGTPTNNSVLKAFTVLRAFRDADEWLSCTELCQRAKLPIASGHRLLQTLERVGAVIRGPQGRYKPGVLLFSLSRKVSLGTILRQVSQGLTSELAELFNLTVHIGVLENGMVTYAVKTCGSTAYPIRTTVGSQLEAYCSGLGKALLAGLSQEEFESFLLEGELVPLTVHTITNRAALRAEIERVRLSGYATDDRESQLDVVCVAVPIIDNEGKMVAALSASDQVRHMTRERQLELRAALRRCADQIAQKMFPDTECVPLRSARLRRLGEIPHGTDQAVAGGGQGGVALLRKFNKARV